MNGRSNLPLHSPDGEWAYAFDAEAERLRRLLGALAATNDAMLRAQTPADLFRQVCDAAVHGGRFVAATVFIAVPEKGVLEPRAVSGGTCELTQARPTISAERRRGRGLVGNAYREGRPAVSQQLQEDPRFAPWRDVFISAGVRSGAAVPLIEAGSPFGVMLFYARDAHAFDEEALRHLERVAGNVSFCLRNMERESERMRHAQELLRFRTAMDMCGDAIYLIDPMTRTYLDVNLTACHDTGYTRDEILAMRASDLVLQSEEELSESYSQVIERGDAGMVSVVPSRLKDGRERVLELHRRAVRTGERWLIVSIARDVTQRHLNERMLAMEHSVTRTLAQPGRTRDIITQVLIDICETTRWMSCAYFTVHDEHGTTRLFAGWSREPEPDGGHSVLQALLGDIAPDGLLGQVARTATPFWADDLHSLSAPLHEANARWRGSSVGAKERARLVYPVLADARVVGVMSFSSEETREPDERLLRSMRVIADQVGQFVQRKRAEAVLRESESRFRALTELSSDWYWEQDAEHRFTRIGRGSGDDPQDDLAMFLGRPLWEVPGLVHDSADLAALRSTLASHGEFRDFEFASYDSRGELRWISISGRPLVDDKLGFTGYRGISRDVTAGRRAQENIAHLAAHDSLTGLPNRNRFAEVLGQALEQARRHDDRLGLLFIDLDRFKLINDTLGHDAGDVLLQEMALRLRECVRASDTIARLGGDEFVVLVRRVNDREDAAVVARKVLDAATRPIRIDGHECRVSASVGICLFPMDGNDEQSLMKAADTAMYVAKQEGKNTFEFYSHEKTAQSIARLKLESNLRRAVDNGTLYLHYQPKVELASGRIVGAEALLRWDCPELGAVSPTEFIPLAEEIGLIKVIGKWVLKQACQQNMAWRRAGLPPITMSVNLSPRQFTDELLTHDIRSALNESGMDAESLELEITEGMVVHDPKRAVALLTAIKQMGVMLAIDDFGTGYSSLGQLKRFPIDALKIDRAFVGEIPHDRDDMALTAAIIAMGKTLRLTVIAEGVETDLQRSFLHDHGCDQMQGHVYSPAVMPEEFAQLLKRSVETVTA